MRAKEAIVRRVGGDGAGLKGRCSETFGRSLVRGRETGAQPGGTPGNQTGGTPVQLRTARREPRPPGGLRVLNACVDVGGGLVYKGGRGEGGAVLMASSNIHSTAIVDARA